MRQESVGDADLVLLMIDASRKRMDEDTRHYRRASEVSTQGHSGAEQDRRYST